MPNGNLYGNQANIFQGPLPIRIVIGMVNADAYNGVYTKNLFNFKNYTTMFLGLTVNGEHLLGKPFQLKFLQEEQIMCLPIKRCTLGTNKMFPNQGNGLPETSMQIATQCMSLI